MAKSLQRIKARELRRNGQSIIEIARSLAVSKGTVSLWCRDIPLSKAQIEKLHKSMVAGGYKGRLKGSQIQKERKLNLIRKYEREGLMRLEKLSKRDLLLMGLGLHLGEGSKGDNRVRFTNSNPSIIKLFLIWIEEIFGVPRSRVSCRVMINEIHRKREEIVRKRWSEILRVPIAQFEKTTFIKAKTKKVYENYDNFLGTLAVTVSKSSDLQYRILGLINGLVYKLCEENKPA